MKKIFAATLFAALAGSSAAFALEPIPGSITYGGEPASRLEKAPVGSPVFHRFSNNGTEYSEIYRIQPDRSLKLVSRSTLSDS
ncbi:hypothetical protein LCM4573_11785 [Rhizobium sp. LCM 4573]|nr:hypothetical protein LCM4573_11785 [Rhizobium sp. LCM 4573]